MPRPVTISVSSVRRSATAEATGVPSEAARPVVRVAQVTLYLVRHGRAGSDDGDPLDTQRHLDNKGRRRAIWLADRLIDQPIDAVWSSPLPRCNQTVRASLAVTAGLDVELFDGLAEGTDIDTSWAVIAQGSNTTETS